jgi:hypothetical protein
MTVAGLLMWGALSDERTGLSFTMNDVQYIYISHVITRMYIQKASVSPGSAPLVNNIAAKDFTVSRRGLI